VERFDDASQVSLVYLGWYEPIYGLTGISSNCFAEDTTPENRLSQ
jgi:hypothetical protein